MACNCEERFWNKDRRVAIGMLAAVALLTIISFALNIPMGCVALIVICLLVLVKGGPVQ